MNYLGHYCRELWERPGITQREISARLRISMARCAELAREAAESGYIRAEARQLTDAGLQYLERFRVKNAIIMAAGIDVRFVPFTHELPKSLMEIEGERIIERTIRQLHERDVRDITIVVGYMAEKFDYLIDKFGVKLIFNPEYETQSNLASVYSARRELGRNYLINAGQWIWQNLFHTYEPESWCTCHWHEGSTQRWCIRTDGKRRVRKLRPKGRDQLALQGPLYFDETFAEKLVPLLEETYRQPGNESMRWEEVLRGHLDDLQLYANVVPSVVVQDFRTFDDLRDFEIGYAEASGNKNLSRIAEIFGVPESRIKNMSWLDIGMTNQSFLFTLDGDRYIYRIPGAGTDSFISRRQEAAVYRAVKKLAISDEVVYFDPRTGIKVTKYLPNSHNVAEDDWKNIQGCMQMLRRLHLAALKVRHVFDIEEKLKSYEAMCRKVNCINFEDYEWVRERVEVPLRVIRSTSEPKTLCHIDSVTNNFLVLEDGSLRLLDWEYGGMCHGVADVAMFAVFSSYTPKQLDKLLEWYFDRPPTHEERKLCYSYAAAAGLLWSLWAEYRQYYGEDFGEYATINYRLGKIYTKLVRAMEGENVSDAAPDAPEPVRQAAIVERKKRYDSPQPQILPELTDGEAVKPRRAPRRKKAAAS